MYEKLGMGRAMALTYRWQKFHGVQPQGDRSVPLVEVQCPFCNHGYPYVEENAKIINADWEQFFEVLSSESHIPQGDAFKWSEEFLPQRFGHVTLKCRNCDNAFYVMYMLAHSVEKPEHSMSWSRLIIPNLDHVEPAYKLDELAKERYQLEQRLEKMTGRQNVLVGVVVVLMLLLFMAWQSAKTLAVVIPNLVGLA